jgi:hypothetical protein
MEKSTLYSMKDNQRYAIIKKLIQKKYSEEEARILLGLKSVRQIRRIKKRVQKDNKPGIIHKGIGKTSNRKLADTFITKFLALIREKYSDFKPTLAAEKLKENHGMTISGETVRKYMAQAKMWRIKGRRSGNSRHVWRERKDNYGEMEQFDGSYHHWFEQRGAEICLLLSIDDATGEITHAKFDTNEGVHAVFHFWLEYFDMHGLPLSIYLDKFSTYKINHPSAVDNADLMTQFQRAMKRVGVEVIHAHSPQAKGRVERVFQTLQDRLVKELRLRNISTIAEANLFLKKYIPKFNKQFAVVPKNPANFHRKISPQTRRNLPQIFSIQSERRVNNDYTVQFKGSFFQLHEKQPTTVYKRDTVIMEEHLDGAFKICLKAHYLEYTILPERPKKQHVAVFALTRTHSGWIPPKDHPWRRYQSTKKNPSESIQAPISTI